ncbi:hypothetical protein Pelo_9161 [Pelomyxa schiedti]|nr:hypothetical protein Pelo_9161 [Pelomyxa schiedti]
MDEQQERRLLGLGGTVTPVKVRKMSSLIASGLVVSRHILEGITTEAGFHDLLADLKEERFEADKKLEEARRDQIKQQQREEAIAETKKIEMQLHKEENEKSPSRTISASGLVKDAKDLGVCHYFEVAYHGLLGCEAFWTWDLACTQLLKCLLSKRGNPCTPIMDQCYGAGKTTLAHGFRNVIQQMLRVASNTELQAFVRENKEEFDKLISSVYVRITFNTVRDEHLLKPDLSEEEYDEFLKSKIRAALALFLSQPELEKPNTPITELASWVTTVAPNTSFLFHFDDVGAIEASKDAIQNLYRLWNVAHGLGHFYILSGRSEYLHWIGKNTPFPGKPITFRKGYSSPVPTSLISVSVFTVRGIAELSESYSMLPLSKSENSLQLIFQFTGGVPRVVRDLLLHLRTVKGFECSDPNEIFQFLTSKTTIRYGLYTYFSEGSTGQVILPYYKILDHLSSNFLNMSIPQPGDQLEYLVMRMLLLRCSILNVQNTTWACVGLPVLDELHIPFVRITTALPAARIHSAGSSSSTDAALFMAAVNGEMFTATVPQQFTRNMMPELARFMKYGVFYYHLPQSGSADADILIGPNRLCSFQMKNLSTPYEVSHLRSEAQKSVVPGWTVNLLLVCTSGISTGPNEDYQETFSFGHDTVVCTALSLRSIEHFLGPVLLSAYRSGTLLTNAVHQKKFSLLHS